MNKDIEDILRAVTNEAAEACYEWIGRGKKEPADNAAVKSIRAVMSQRGLRGKIIIGEGEKDNAPMLYKGESFGDPDSDDYWDIAIDPLEGTTNLAKGLSNSMSVIAICEKNKMLDPGPSFYMDKFVTSGELKGKIDIEAPIRDILTKTARALGKKLNELNIFVLDKPRHKNLINTLHSLECRISLHPAGDVGGALLAALPGTKTDLLLGTGGTPEGIISACAVKAIGGEIYCRLDPQLPTEIIALRKQGYSVTQWYGADELIQTDNLYFCATGITGGELFDGVRITEKYKKFESLILSGVGQERKKITAFKDVR